MKVAVKQTYGDIDAIMFEAALVANAKETQNKRKEYIRWLSTKNLIKIVQWIISYACCW